MCELPHRWLLMMATRTMTNLTVAELAGTIKTETTQMKLNTKLLITHVIVGIILLALASYLVSVSLEEREFNSIRQSFISQLYQVDFALTSFLVEVEYDVLDLMESNAVRTREDQAFTSFLDADEATFEYNIGETEQAIIDIFSAYRLNHPYANSVYMGRENGSFVRS